MRPYLRVANVFEDRIDVTDVLRMNFTPAEAKIYALQHGDILLNEGQSIELVGRPAMFKNEVPGACFQNTLIRFRADPAVLPAFALIVFRAYLHSQRFQTIAKRTTNIAHLSASRFAQMPFPLPPLAEQEEIVKQVTANFAHVRTSQQAAEAGLARSTQLRQQVIQEAFTGRLATQDPRDEPTGALLERIRQERREALKAPPRSQVSILKHKGTRTMPQGSKRPLVDVLKEHPKGLTPDALLRAAGYEVDEIDEFYVALRSLGPKLNETRAAREDILRWPANTSISLRLEGGRNAHR